MDDRVEAHRLLQDIHSLRRGENKLHPKVRVADESESRRLSTFTKAMREVKKSKRY